MSVVNLSEEYRRNGSPSLYERIRMFFDLDVYWASSLLEIEDHFKTNSPRKRDIYQSAYVILRNVEIKRTQFDSFDKDDDVSLRGLDDGLVHPLFKVRDHTTERLAYWYAGNSVEYAKAKHKFRFNKDNFILLPKVILQYIQINCNKNGLLRIIGLGESDTPQREKKSLKDRVIGMVPQVSIASPELGYA